MRRNVVLVILCLGIYSGLLGVFEFNQNPFESEAIDARAEALGRASLLSTSGANLVFNNSAMLSKLENINIQVSGRSVSGKYWAKTNTKYGSYKLSTSKPGNSDLNGFSIGVPFKLSKNFNLGFGAGLRTYYDYNFDFQQKQEVSNTIYQVDSEGSGAFKTIVLGGGVSFLKKFYSGISISLPFSSEFSRSYKYNSAYNGEYEDYEVDCSMEGTFYTFSGGYLLNNYISFGAKYRTAYDVDYELTEEGQDDYNAVFTIPSELSVAMEIQTRKKLKLYLEYLTRNLSGYEYENEYNSGNIFYNSDNGYALRGGAEIGNKTKFRCGIFMQSVPQYERKQQFNELTDEYDIIYTRTPKRELGFTTGIGLRFLKSITLDIYAVYSRIKFNENLYDYDYSLSLKNEYFYSDVKLGCTLGYNF